MIAVVTGSSGFIGSHLVAMLRRHGFTVRCLDNRPNPDTSSHDLQSEHYTLDCGDRRALQSTPALKGVDYVFHLAGVTKAISLDEFRRWNVLPTRNLLQTLKKREIRLKRFIYVSSQAAAGPAPTPDQPTTEETPTSPVEAYGRSKLEAERTVREFGSCIPWTVVRPASVYGPRDVDFLNIFKQTNRHLSVYPGYRDNIISVIFVTDLVSGVLQAARSKRTEGKTYFLSADESVSWRQVHRTIARVEDNRVIELSIPQAIVNRICKAGDLYTKLSGRYTIVNTRKAALSQPRYWICSAQRAKKDFGFKTKISLLEGLKITYQWYREHAWL